MLVHCNIHGIELSVTHVPCVLFKIKNDFQLEKKATSIVSGSCKDNKVKQLMKAVSNSMKVSSLFV